MNLARNAKRADSPAVRSLDRVCMSEADRALAKQQMRQAEIAVDLICALLKFVQSMASQFKRRQIRRPTAFL